MAKYKSNYAKLGFYVDGERRQFQGGVYEATDKKEVEVLDGLTDAQRVDEPKAEPKAPSKSEETKQSTKKSTVTARKSSAK